MTGAGIEVRTVPAQHVARLVGYAPRMGPQFVGPVVGPMFAQVEAALAAAGTPVVDAPVGVYEATDDGGVRVVVAFPVAPDVTAVDGLDVGTLPGLARAAVMVHRGSPDTLGAAWAAYRERLAIEGHETTSHSREIYVSPPEVPQDDWETLLVAELR